MCGRALFYFLSLRERCAVPLCVFNCRRSKNIPLATNKSQIYVVKMKRDRFNVYSKLVAPFNVFDAPHTCTVPGEIRTAHVCHRNMLGCLSALIQKHIRLAVSSLFTLLTDCQKFVVRKHREYEYVVIVWLRFFFL